MTKPKPVSDKLRDAITRAEERGKSRGEIARAAGISVTAVTNFLAGGDMKLEVADAIARGIGYQVNLTRKG